MPAASSRETALALAACSPSAFGSVTRLLFAGLAAVGQAPSIGGQTKVYGSPIPFDAQTFQSLNTRRLDAVVIPGLSPLRRPACADRNNRVREAMIMLKVFFLLVSLTFLCGAAASITIAFAPTHVDETAGYGTPS